MFLEQETLAKANNKTNVWIPGLEFFIKSVMTTIYLPAFTKGFRLQESRREKMLKTHRISFRFDKGALHESQGITTISRICKVLILCLAVAGTGDLFNAGAATVKELSYWQLMM
jgi:Fe(3+) dicitrate transport protein